ncbi:hypothetical protein A2118_00630 [Candidatus Kaiserbacteria bacterium GWA2_50_9]|uniref:FecR protein domain-containing protein n=1 Tax=Candidatus Kaiserbacteria bacterium GWA2_50_9 TaxID=1798474 RepID=A0A1F6BVT1_9BACT|nr:MAG: hypothetical protein A2118_00630 [Candidatus Kaiserbacteria bacterium GWA2_50_9]
MPTATAQNFPVRIVMLIVGVAAVIVVLSIVSAVAFEYRKEYPPRESNLASVLLVLSPNVFVQQEGGAERPVEGTVEIGSGSAVRTSGSGSAVLLYPNGTMTALEGDTSVVVDEIGENGNRSRLSLLGGTMWSRIEQLLDSEDYFQVRSRGIVTSVRGTSFEMSANDAGLSVTVLSDIVSIAREAGLSTSSVPFAEATVVAGERLSLTSDETGKVESALQQLTESVLAEKINKQAQLASRPAVGDIVLFLENLPLPDAGRGTSRTVHRIERFIESLAGAAERDPDAKTRRLLGQAAERLAEVRERGEVSVSVQELLYSYEDLIGRALAEASDSKNPETRSLVAQVTLAHLDVLKSILSEIPEEDRPFVKETIMVARADYISAIQELAKENPKESLAQGIRGQKHFLADAQESAANGNSIDAFEDLRIYDRQLQALNAIAKSQPDLMETYSEALTRSLRTIETIDSVARELPPGIGDTVDSVRDRSINSHLAGIADMMLVDAPRAAIAFDRAAKHYADDMNRIATSSPRALIEKKAEAYRVYETFGRDMAASAQGLRTGATTVTELVREATAKHRSVLETAVREVPPPASEEIRRVLKETEEKVLPNEKRPASPEEFVREREAERPVGDLPRPEAIPQMQLYPQRNQVPGEIGPSVFPESGEKSKATPQGDRPNPEIQKDEPGGSGGSRVPPTPVPIPTPTLNPAAPSQVPSSDSIEKKTKDNTSSVGSQNSSTAGEIKEQDDTSSADSLRSLAPDDRP